MLIKDFGLLFYSPGLNETIYSNCDKLLLKSNKLIYVFDSTGAIKEISKKRCTGNLVPIVNILDYHHDSPIKIYFDHGKINLDFEIID